MFKREYEKIKCEKVFMRELTIQETSSYRKEYCDDRVPSGETHSSVNGSIGNEFMSNSLIHSMSALGVSINNVNAVFPS